MTDDAVAWLRKQIENDLERWRERVSMLTYTTFVNTPVGTVFTGSIDKVLEMDDAGDRVADCEAKLGILDEHGGEHMCFSNSHDGSTWDYWIGDCRVMTSLASAYRRRDGYAGHWGAGA